MEGERPVAGAKARQREWDESSHLYAQGGGIVRVFYCAIFVLTGGLHVWYVCRRGFTGTVGICHMCTCNMDVMCVTCIFTCLWYIYFCV